MADAMDVWEATKVVFDRVHMLDPDNASKIIGLLLIQDNGDKELIRLAFGPDHLLHTFVATTRANLAAKTMHVPMHTTPPWGLQIPRGGNQQLPFITDEVGYEVGETFYAESEYNCWSSASGGPRRSFSLSDAKEGAWRSCIFFARGYCKNGSSCRFMHGLPKDNVAVVKRDMGIMHPKALVSTRPRQLMATTFPFSTSPPKGVSLNFLLHQQREHQRAAAAAMLHGEEDMHIFLVRSPRMNQGDLIASPAARQIYMTFPADSTFSVEDVSNYFSMYGPVHDVRIPYQKKRMFGFVAFVYAESVKIILSKGNPHFLCNARLLVKPYREKNKVPVRKLHGDFDGCMSPTDLLDPRDPFDLQKPQIGPRMVYGNIACHEAFLRRKLEEQPQEAELHQAIGTEGDQFMGLKLLDPKSRGHHLYSPMPLGQGDGKGNINGNSNAIHLEDVTIQDRKMNNSGLAMGVHAATTTVAVSATYAEGKHEVQQVEDGDSSPKKVVNLGEEEKEYGHVIAITDVACGFHESDMLEHILPESPFASPTKASIDASTTGQNGNISNSSPHLVSPSLLPSTSTLELPPYNSCFFQVPRFSPRHEAIGLGIRGERGSPLGLWPHQVEQRVEESFDKY